MRRIVIMLLGLLCCNFALAGCQREDMPERTEIVISAASSLVACLDELKENYEARHNTVELKFNFGGSGSLQRQIEWGAPVHLFLSAGEHYMEQLADKGYILDYRVLFSNRLVAVIQTDSPLVIQHAEQLATSISRLAIGEPDRVPAGFYARQSLQHHQLWEALKPDLIFTKDVRQALHMVETGNVDAAYVYETDAKSSDKVRIVYNADPESHSPIVYLAGVVKGSGKEEAVLDFWRYLAEDEAQQIFRKHGFYVPQIGG